MLEDIEICGVAFKVLNLVGPITLDTEVYPGDPKPKRMVFSDISETGYEHHIHKIGDHLAHPHGDSTGHQVLGGDGIEAFDSREFEFNNACLIDLSDAPEAKEYDGIKYLVEVTEKHLFKHVSKMSRVNAILIRTGYDNFLEANKKHIPENIPYLTKEAAGLLAKLKNIRVVGIDSITIDACGREEPVHDAHEILTKDKFVVESIVNLHKMPRRNRFTLQTGIGGYVQGSTGAPVLARVYFSKY